MLSSTARRRGFAATAEVTFAPSLEMDLGQCRDAWTSDGGASSREPGYYSASRSSALQRRSRWIWTVCLAL